MFLWKGTCCHIFPVIEIPASKSSEKHILCFLNFLSKYLLITIYQYLKIKKIYFSFFIRNFLQKSASNTDKLKHTQTPRSKLYYIGFWILRLLHPRINLNQLINHGLFIFDKYEYLKIKRFIFQMLKDFFSRSQQATEKLKHTIVTKRQEVNSFIFNFWFSHFYTQVNLNPLINHGLTPQSWDTKESTLLHW